MKRFLFEIGVSIVMITIGATMAFFELSEYDIENAYQEVAETQRFETSATAKDPLRIDLDEDYEVAFITDDSLKDDVIVEVGGMLDASQKDDDRIRIRDYSWRRFPYREVFDIFIKGLKEEKLYYFDDSEYAWEQEIIIRCAKENRKNIDLRY